MIVEYHVYDSGNSTFLAVLHEAFNRSYMAELNGIGYGEFSMPIVRSEGGDITHDSTDDILAETGDTILYDDILPEKYQHVTNDNVVRVNIDGTDVGAFVIENVEEDLLNGEDVLKASGRGLLAIFERAIVWPSDIGDAGSVERVYLGKTFAYIIDDLIDEAVARSVSLPSIDFSATLDSNGDSWTDSYTMNQRAGQTLLDVILQHAELEPEVTVTPASVLQYWLSYGSDLSSSIFFREGHNLLSAKRMQTRKELRNAVLGEGQYILDEATDASSISSYGRRETRKSYGNTSDATQLGELGDISVAQIKDPITSVEVTATDTLVPFSDYNIGDTVRLVIPTGSINTSYRVRSIAMQQTSGADFEVALVMNTLIDEYWLRVDRTLRRDQISPVDTIVSPNTDPNIGGWTISNTQLTGGGGSAIFHSSGYLQLGTGNDIVRLDAVDATYRMWVGSSSAGSAPFRVTKAGAVTMTNATITGSSIAGYIPTEGAAGDVNAYATTIDGGKITTGSITALQIDARTITAAEIVIGTITDTELFSSYINTTGAAADVNANATTISGGKITTGSITALQIDANTITANEIVVGTITDTELANTYIYEEGAAADVNAYGTTVDGTKITATTITGTQVSTMNLVGKTITADTGTVGGWTLGASSFTGGNATLHNTGYLLLGTGNDIIRLDAANATYRMWIGNATATSAPFRITKAGYVTASSGIIGGWTLSGTSLTAGDMIIDSANERIYFYTDKYIWWSSSSSAIGVEADLAVSGVIYSPSPIDIDGGTSTFVNLSTSGDLTVGDDLLMTGGNITATTTAASLGGTTVNGLLQVTGAIDVRGNIRDDGGTLTLGDDVAITNTLDARGAIFNSTWTYVSFSEGIYVDGASQFTNNVEIDGALNHDGSTVGFYNTTPATKQTVTGSRGGNAALASLLTALSTIGLITDSSS